MPLENAKPGTPGFSRNIATEIKAGKPQKQAVAIAYSKARGDATVIFLNPHKALGLLIENGWDKSSAIEQLVRLKNEKRGVQSFDGTTYYDPRALSKLRKAPPNSSRSDASSIAYGYKVNGNTRGTYGTQAEAAKKAQEAKAKYPGATITLFSYDTKGDGAETQLRMDAEAEADCVFEEKGQFWFRMPGFREAHGPYATEKEANEAAVKMGVVADDNRTPQEKLAVAKRYYEQDLRSASSPAERAQIKEDFESFKRAMIKAGAKADEDKAPNWGVTWYDKEGKRRRDIVRAETMSKARDHVRSMDGFKSIIDVTRRSYSASDNASPITGMIEADASSFKKGDWVKPSGSKMQMKVEETKNQNGLEMVKIGGVWRAANEFSRADTEDPCWSGYHAEGMKEKGSKTVPNCIPDSEIEGEAIVGKRADASYGGPSRDQVQRLKAAWAAYPTESNERAYKRAKREFEKAHSGNSGRMDAAEKDEEKMTKADAEPSFLTLAEARKKKEQLEKKGGRYQVYGPAYGTGKYHVQRLDSDDSAADATPTIVREGDQWIVQVTNGAETSVFRLSTKEYPTEAAALEYATTNPQYTNSKPTNILDSVMSAADELFARAAKADAMSTPERSAFEEGRKYALSGGSARDVSIFYGGSVASRALANAWKEGHRKGRSEKGSSVRKDAERDLPGPSTSEGGYSDDAETEKLKKIGMQQATKIHSNMKVREWARKQGYNRAEEAFIMAGWSYGRKVEGLSETA